MGKAIGLQVGCPLGVGVFVSLALLGGAVSSAQEEGSAMRVFRVLGYGDGFFEDIYFEKEGFEEKESVELEFVPDRKSRAYAISEEERATVFFREYEDEEGESQRLELGRVRWSSEVEAATLVFLEREESRDEESPYQILVADESSERWGPNCFRFLNLSGASLRCQIEDGGVEVGQGLSEVFEFDEELTGPVRMSFEVEWEGESQTIYSARILPNKSRGKLYVIKPPLELGTLRLRVVNVW